MTTVREHNLTALLDRQTLVLNQFVIQDVHHLELVAITNNHVEAAWVESQCMRFKVAFVAQLRSEARVASVVRPKTNSTIGRACGNKLFFNANIEAMDLLRMEG